MNFRSEPMAIIWSERIAFAKLGRDRILGNDSTTCLRIVASSLAAGSCSYVCRWRGAFFAVPDMLEFRHVKKDSFAGRGRDGCGRVARRQVDFTPLCDSRRACRREE